MEIYFFTGSWCITEHCYVWWRWERKIWSFVDVSGSSKIHASLAYECKVNSLLLFSLMFQSPVSYIVLILTITVITPLTRLSLLQWKGGSFKKVDCMLLSKCFWILGLMRVVAFGEIGFIRQAFHLIYVCKIS